MAKLVVDLKSRPKGEKVEVLYLGVFANGETHDLTDEQVEQYEATSRVKFPESGYLFSGDVPTNHTQKEAYEKNQKADIVPVDNAEQPPATQIDGGYSDGTGENQGLDEDVKEGDK